MNKLVFLFALLFIFGKLCGQNENPNNPLSLNEAIEIALEKNPEILAAQKEIDAARGRTLQAGRIPNPEIGVTYNEIPGIKFGSANEKDIGFFQPFEFPGKRSGRISAATMDEQLVATFVEQIKVRVATNVKKSYVNAQSAQSIVGSIEKQIELLRDLQNTITDKYKTGETKYLDVLRIEVEATRLQNDLIEAKNNYFASLTELKNSIGDSVVALYEPKDTLSFSPFISDKDSLIEELTQQSSTLQLARLGIERQQSVLSLARTSYYPDFGVGLAYQRRTPADSYLGIEAKVSIPLWFWQEPQGQVEEAAAELSIAEIQLLSLERTIRNNINRAYTSVHLAEQQVKNFEQILQKGFTDILNVAGTQYRNNQLDLLNLFDIYRIYRATQIDYFRSVANYQQAVTELEISSEIFNE